MVVIGYMLKKMGFMNERFAKEANRLVFRIFMPVMLFVNIYKIEDLSMIDFEFMGFAAIALLIVFFLAIPTSIAVARQKNRRGVLIQAIIRSGYSLIGFSVAGSLCPEGGLMVATILSVIIIPMFNILTVISLVSIGNDSDEKPGVWKIVRDILTNPLIVGIAIGLVCIGIRTIFGNVGIEFRLSQITPVMEVLEYLARLAIPLALLVLGAQFEFSAVASLKREIIWGVVIRTVIVPTLVIGVAYVVFGNRFGAAQFATLVAAFATPVAVPSVPMVQEMGGDVTLAGQLVVWSTLVSAVTIFLVTFLLRLGGAF
jgi:predicted permease